MLNWVILNAPYRKDKRNVAVANALYANIHTDWISFFDALSPRDYPDGAAIVNAAIEDGFPQFHEAGLSDLEIDVKDILDAWNLLRYLRTRAENDDPKFDLFIRDDVYFRQFGHELLTEHFLLIAREHLLKYCEKEGLDFQYLIFSKDDIPYVDELPMVTGYCFHPGETPSVDVRAIFVSQTGAQTLLKRISARINLYFPRQVHFRDYIFSKYNIPGGFSTTIKTVDTYPKDFLGDDINPDQTAYQGDFKRLFEAHTYYE